MILQYLHKDGCRYCGSCMRPSWRPRKHKEAWSSENKCICISNAAFVKWKKLHLINPLMENYPKYSRYPLEYSRHLQTLLFLGGKDALAQDQDKHTIFILIHTKHLFRNSSSLFSCNDVMFIALKRLTYHRTVPLTIHFILLYVYIYT